MKLINKKFGANLFEKKWVIPEITTDGYIEDINDNKVLTVRVDTDAYNVDLREKPRE